jgi:light-regulated signal transduction histidine kinase (bacteriophytochrome)
MSPEQSREDVARLREFQKFLDGAIHSFRAGLRSVGTSAAFLSQRWNLRFDEEARALNRGILDGVTELNGLTKALSEYSFALVPRISTEVPFPLENALQSALASLQPLIDETKASVYAGKMPKIEADHEQMGLLFRCLVANALEYRGKNSAPRIEITATAAEDEWRFAVGDNGIGIAPRFQRLVFEPFERLHNERRGFGLGLAICRKIVSGHGGRLWVDSREGEGSTFFFTIPMHLSAAT